MAQFTAAASNPHLGRFHEGRTSLGADLMPQCARGSDRQSPSRGACLGDQAVRSPRGNCRRAFERPLRARNAISALRSAHTYIRGTPMNSGVAAGARPLWRGGLHEHARSGPNRSERAREGASSNSRTVHIYLFVTGMMPNLRAELKIIITFGVNALKLQTWAMTHAVVGYCEPI